MVGTLVGLGTASVAGMIVGKICEECGKANWAQYVNLATTAFLAGTALTGVMNLFKLVSGMGA
jgi:hypothetical protein